MNNFRNNCPICNSYLNNNFQCSDILCYKNHEYEGGGERSDFYLGKYIIEYSLKEDGTFDYAEVFKRGAGEYGFKLYKPLNFNNGLNNLINKLDQLILFK